MGAVLAAGALLLAGASGSAAQEPQLTVTADQVVTLSGSTTSLRDVIQQLCAASGVELRQYDAQDRPFIGNYESMPLSELLPRLLRSESYAAGLRSAGEDRGARIAWIRVMSRAEAKATESFRPTPVPVPAAVADDGNDGADDDKMTEAQLPPEQAATIIAALLNPAFTTVDDEAARKDQVEKIAQNFASNPAAKQTLERADLAAVGRKLAEFPDARSVFAMVQSSIHDPEMQRYFNQIAGALNTPVAASLKH
jgi:hypothetical protein